MASSSNLNIMQSGIAYKFSHNMLPTAVEDARTPQQQQPGNTSVETSIVPWEASESTPERPEWLLEGWEMIVMTRKNGKTDGVKDRERVEYFIKWGMIRSSTPRSDISATDGHQQSVVRFDPKNCPTKICWVLNNCSEGLWTPYINNEEQPELAKRLWAPQWKTLLVVPTNFRGDGEKMYKGGPEVQKGTKEVLKYEERANWFCRWRREKEQRRS